MTEPKTLKMPDATLQSSSPAETATDFWNKRKNTVFFCVLQNLFKNLIKKPKSVLDVGIGKFSSLDWLDADSKTSIDSKHPYEGLGIKSITANFLSWNPEKIFPISISLFGLERSSRPEVYAKKLLQVSNIVIVSVPYKLSKEYAGSQINVDINEETMRNWFGREPNFSYVCRELKDKSDRLIQVYEKNDDYWDTLTKRTSLLNERMQNITISREPTSRDFNQFRKPVVECISVDDFFQKFSHIDAGYSISLGKEFLDLEVHAKNSDTVVFCFNGAIDRDAVKTLPSFAMRKISEGAEGTFVFISDPVFYLSKDLTLGWYGGTIKNPLQPLLDKIAEFIIHTLSAKRVLLFGGSAGGFASLYYSRQIKKSLALIWNPQTILNNYYKHLVSRYSYLAYDCSLQNLSKHMVTNIPEFYKKVHGNNRIIYMQNVSDHHVETHLKPFLQIIGRDVPKNEYSQWIDENLYLHISNWSEGHTPPPRKTLQQLLEKFCQPSFEWTSENIALAMAEAEASANTAKN